MQLDLCLLMIGINRINLFIFSYFKLESPKTHSKVLCIYIIHASTVSMFNKLTTLRERHD